MFTFILVSVWFSWTCDISRFRKKNVSEPNRVLISYSTVLMSIFAQIYLDIYRAIKFPPFSGEGLSHISWGKRFPFLYPSKSGRFCFYPVFSYYLYESGFGFKCFEYRIFSYLSSRATVIFFSFQSKIQNMFPTCDSRV